MTDPTYVLVHGGWGGAWVWRDLGAELTRREVPWTAVDLPSAIHGAHPNTFLADDAREVAVVANDEGPVVLVGHSYGGAVLCEAAQDVTHLQRLVYIAALVPLLGESATESVREVQARTVLDEAIQVDGDFLTLEPNLAKKRALSGLHGRDDRLGADPTHATDHRKFSKSAKLFRRRGSFVLRALHA